MIRSKHESCLGVLVERVEKGNKSGEPGVDEPDV
jgi:hypothetical protein